MAVERVVARPREGEHGEDTGRYVARVSGDDVLSVLEAQRAEVRRLAGLPEARALFRYAPGKWSVKEVVGHLTDAERIYGYRALRFARHDATSLPGFDEDAYVPAARFDRRALSDLVAEWDTVRAATLSLFRGLDDDALLRRGVANDHEISVRALAWVAAGHTLHHLGVLRERYGVA
jgi:hypothetical protein